MNNQPSWCKVIPNDDYIYESFYNNNKNQVEFLWYNKILNKGDCICGSQYTLSQASTRESQRYKAYYVLRCGNNHICSVNHFSYLHKKKIDKFKMIQLFYKFYNGINATDCAKQIDINPKIVQKYYLFFRKCTNVYMQQYYLPIYTLVVLIKLHKMVLVYIIYYKKYVIKMVVQWSN